jgi:hypothetical protein
MHNLPTNNETNLIRDIFARTTQVNKQLQEGKDTKTTFDKTKEGMEKTVAPAVATGINKTAGKVAGVVTGVGRGVAQASKDMGITDAVGNAYNATVDAAADLMAPIFNKQLEWELDTPEKREIEARQAAAAADPELQKRRLLDPRNKPTPPMTEAVVLPPGVNDVMKSVMGILNPPSVSGGMSSKPITDFSPGAQAARVAARDSAYNALSPNDSAYSAYNALSPNATPYQRADVAARELEAKRRVEQATQRQQNDTTRLGRLSAGYSKISQSMGGKPVTWENSDETIKQAHGYLSYKGIHSADATPEQLQQAITVGKQRTKTEEEVKTKREIIAREQGFGNNEPGTWDKGKFEALQDKLKAERDANQQRWENSPNNPKNKKPEPQTGPQLIPESYYRRLANLFEETREPSGPQVNQAAYGFDPRGGRNARKAEASLRSGMWRGDSTTKGSTRNPKKERNIGKRELSGEDIKQAVATLYSAAMEHPEFRRMSEIGEFGKAHIMSPSSSAHKALLAKYPEGHEVHQASAKILKYGNR